MMKKIKHGNILEEAGRLAAPGYVKGRKGCSGADFVLGSEYREGDSHVTIWGKQGKPSTQPCGKNLIGMFQEQK